MVIANDVLRLVMRSKLALLIYALGVTTLTKPAFVIDSLRAEEGEIVLSVITQPIQAKPARPACDALSAFSWGTIVGTVTLHRLCI